MAAKPSVLRVTSRNAAFQQWRALLTNRVKRQRAREFIIQGVRPVTLAVERDWPVDAMIYDISRPLSRWAQDMLAASGAQRVAMAPELLRELGGKDDGVPEMVAVAAIPPDDFSRISPGSVSPGADLLAVAFDRPASPGNIGTVIRAADAFGAHGLIVTGHAADPYDPKSVRASTGSLFAVPVVRADSHADVIKWARRRSAAIVGTDERDEADIADTNLAGPTVIVIGNEATGVSAAWRQACDVVARIPITGAASSLNAAGAATVVLYEAARQRRAKGLSAMGERGRVTSIGERVRQVHLDHFCPGGAGLPVTGSGPIGLVLPDDVPAGWDSNCADAAGRRCGRCGQPMTPRQDVRRRADGSWVHEACPGRSRSRSTPGG